ncbi:MAG TPA: isopentenyl-diphosphate Delta-isomerase [Kineosporiaceae bacterium]|nr:isopentenyl-diphosphate Delta-isomerase [Kineosporiaceae bacterium]
MSPDADSRGPQADDHPRAAGADDAHRLVVLLDDDGRPCGTVLKSEVHTRDTPLHLAFSCWVFDHEGRTLLTQRSPAKLTWPGVWTNSFCGHPEPGEDLQEAVHRRAWDELGARLAGVRPALPTFRYRAVSASGIVENEICPVYTARLASALDPHPDEVADLRWTTLTELRTETGAAAEGHFSPWMLEQLAGLADSAGSSGPSGA